jgi:hypothetical protein
MKKHNLLSFIEDEHDKLSIIIKDDIFIVKINFMYEENGVYKEGAYTWCKCDKNMKVISRVYSSSSMYDGGHFIRKVNQGDYLYIR